MELQRRQELFKEDFESLKLPGQKRIEQVMKLSHTNNVEIHKRKRDTIKEKISNMMIKLKRK